ncbi:MAG TPA: hypothetical protein VLM85_30005 [Polyangiaceae bacterium]|nr:hypothetical protein [Polyangiaceae bacterium]
MTAEQRREYLGAARILDDVDPKTRNLLAGPPALGVNQRISCRFMEPYADIVLAHGTTPKLFCAPRRTHEIVEIKYGRADGEIYGEVLGSRLLWARGGATDADYAVPVHSSPLPLAQRPGASCRSPARPLATPL